MMQDIERICDAPSDEDRAWFPDFAGKGNAYGVLREIWENYRDESFVAQYLSPTVMRSMGLFRLSDNSEEDEYTVADIHDERGYRKVRRALARQYDVAAKDPDIQIVDVDLAGDRCLELRHFVKDRILLDDRETQRVLQNLADAWGYEVRLIEADDDNEFSEFMAMPCRPIY